MTPTRTATFAELADKRTCNLLGQIFKDQIEENRRMRQLKKQGWSDADIKSWLRGWRQPARTK